MNGELEYRDINFPGCDDNPSLVIPADRFWVEAKNNSALDRSRKDWGYRFTVKPIGKQALLVS